MAKLSAGVASNVNSIAVAATLLLLLLALTAEAKEGYDSKVEEKTSDLHFYFHDTVSGKNVTTMPVARANGTNSSPNLFGLVVVIDDIVTKGPEPTSQLLGRMQGLYTLSGLEEPAMQMVVTLVFSSGQYNGSTLSVVGINPIYHPVREIPIVGGSGLFRLARGYVLARTHSLVQNGNAVVECNVTVLHY